MKPFDWYRGTLAWLPARTIFLTKHGSQAYGTSLPTSDLDIKGVAIPPKEYFLGYLNRFEQAECREPVDAVVYDIRKFVGLAADCNPNIIEVLFTDPSDWIVRSKEWHALREKRDLFISQKARHTFSGYAMSQLKRIRSHRKWLLDPPKKQPERADYDLPGESTIGREQLGVVEARIRKLTDVLASEGWTKDKVEVEDEAIVSTVAEQIELPKNLIPIIIAERKYGAAMRNWVSYGKWREERNATRSALEAKFGFDTKHAMHLVRLMRMASEILAKGEVLVRRPDAEELLAIRAGAWKYDDLIAWAEATEASLASIVSPLPKSPDRVAIDALVVAIVESYLS